MTGYPYYYIGVDSWFDTGRILVHDLPDYVQGSIGTVPWQTDAMELDRYAPELQPVINESMKVYNHLLASWQEYWDMGYTEKLYVHVPSSTAIYGYDSMYTLAYALEIYLTENTITDNNINITKLNEIILGNKINNKIINGEPVFIGASGNVRFDENGDRSEGLYSFGNALKNGTVAYFGYFYQTGDTLRLEVDYDKIIWPEYFTQRDMTPRSHVLTIDTIKFISQNLIYIIYVLSGVSIAITITYAILTWKYRNNRVLRAASWRINLVMCLGCLFGYVRYVRYRITFLYPLTIKRYLFCF